MSLAFLKEDHRVLEVKDDCEERPHKGWSVGVEVGRHVKRLVSPTKSLCVDQVVASLPFFCLHQRFSG